jgi:hypothetical protein
VTIARNAPLNEAGWRHSIMISEKKKVIFFAGGLDRTNCIEKIYEINFTAHVVFGRYRKLFVGPIEQNRTVMRRCGGPPAPSSRPSGLVATRPDRRRAKSGGGSVVP